MYIFDIFLKKSCNNIVVCRCRIILNIQAPPFPPLYSLPTNGVAPLYSNFMNFNAASGLVWGGEVREGASSKHRPRIKIHPTIKQISLFLNSLLKPLNIP